MLHILTPPSPPPDLHPPRPAIMPECLDFFESPSRRPRPPNPDPCTSGDNGGSSGGGGGAEELNLGLSLGHRSSATPSTAEKMEQEAGFARLRRECSGSFSLPIESSSTSGSADAQREVASAARALLTFQGPRFVQKDSDESAGLSRDQVWKSLQRNGSVSSQDPPQRSGFTDYGCGKDKPSSLWSWRSTSMLPIMPVKEGTEGTDPVPCPIRRSCSNSVSLAMARHQHMDLPVDPLPRQISSIETLADRTPDRPPLSQQQLEAVELQKKREMQAQRRQEARKRRKSLIEERLQKKCRQNSGIPLCNGTQASSRQSVQSIEKLPSVGSTWSEFDGKEPPEDEKLKSTDGRKNIKQGEEKKVKSARCAERSEFDEEVGLEMDTLKADDDIGSRSVYYCGRSQKPIAGCSYMSSQTMMLTSHAMGLTSEDLPAEMVIDQDVDMQVTRLKTVPGGKGRNSSRSSSSGTATVETKEDDTSAEDISGDHEASSQRSAGTEGSHKTAGPEIGHGCSAGMTTSPPGHSHTCPALSTSYPFPVHNAASVTKPIPTSLSFPPFIQHAVAAGPNRCNSLPSSQLPATVPSTLNSGFKYPFQLPDGHAWFRGSEAGSAGSMQSMGCLDPNSLTHKDREDRHNEGSLIKDGEKGVPNQIYRPIASTKSIAGAFAERSSVNLDDKGAVKMSLPIERQQSWPFVDRPLSQGPHTGNRHLSSSQIQRPMSHVQNIELKRGSSGDFASYQMAGVVIKQEASVESRTSENLGQEFPKAQPKLTEKQLHGMHPDLPWVTTTGSGPKGKTISGVMYISNSKQVRLICSCHGNHMSPVEFVEHSGSDNLSNPERSIVVNAFPFLTRVASTPV